MRQLIYIRKLQGVNYLVNSKNVIAYGNTIESNCKLTTAEEEALLKFMRQYTKVKIKSTITTHEN